MTEKKKPSLVTVLLWVVGLAVVADIVIVVSRPPKVPEIPSSQNPATTVAGIVAVPMPAPPATAPAASVTKGASNEPLSIMDLSTSEGLEIFRQKQMAELRKQAKDHIGDPTHYHASEEEIRIMESNKAIVW